MIVPDQSTPISQIAKNVPVKQIDSPYRFNIDEDRSTLQGRDRFKNKQKTQEVFLDGVYIRFHTQIHCQLRAFWFVNIQGFYSELDSIDFRLSLSENRFLKNNSVHQETYR
jgi:hypothetical protein